MEITTSCAKEIFLRCDPASICPPGSPPGQHAQGFYTCLPRILERAGAEMGHVVLERVFFRNLAADYEVFTKIRREAYRQGGVLEDQMPVVSYVEQPPCTADQAFELQVYAVVPQSAQKASVSTVPALGNGASAKVVEMSGFRHFYARGITGNGHVAKQGAAFREHCDGMFKAAAELLGRHGASFRDVLRMWCYLSNIEQDYQAFNHSRNEFFQLEDVRRLPASTGIGAGLYPPSALCGLDLYALLNPDSASVEVLHCDTLNEAHAYGSSFSRGMKLCLPEKTVLYISGTASVDETGATAHVGDARRQIERMLLNVEELLTPQDAGFSDLVQVTSYLKNSSDLDLFRAVVKRWGLTDMPNSIVTASACRPDLLCQIEAIAVWTADGTGGDARPRSRRRRSGLAEAYVIRSGTPETEIPERLNAATTFIDVHVAEGRGAKTAILCQDRAVTYDDLHDGVNRVGNALRTMGVRMEERVAILLIDSPEWVLAFFGAMKIGAVAVPMNTNLKPKDYEYLLNDSRARVLFVDQSLLAHIERDPRPPRVPGARCGGGRRPEQRVFARACDERGIAVARTGADQQGRHGVLALQLGHDGVSQGGDPPAPRHARRGRSLRPRDPGPDSGGRFVFRGQAVLRLRPGKRALLSAPHGRHDRAAARPADAGPVFEVIDRHQPTVFYSVPTSYAAMLHQAETTGRTSLGRVRMCVSAGEPLPKHLFDKWQERFGVEILDGIGSTEILHIFISNRPGQRGPGSTGQIVPGYEAKIVDEDGEPLPPGDVGTLLIKGDSIASGYWNKHEQTKDTFCGEWINTHDKFLVDEDGYFWYAGRTDDMMKVSGQAVWPADVEGVLMQAPGRARKRRCRHATRRPDQAGGLRRPQGRPRGVARLWTASCRSSSRPQRLRTSIRGRSSSSTSLPKTATGKIKRYKLREMAKQQQILVR